MVFVVRLWTVDTDRLNEKNRCFHGENGKERVAHVLFGGLGR
jgi:hypothetical protein